MKDADFIAAMSVGIPTLPKPEGLMSIDCTGVLKGNADLELSDIERIEGICAMLREIGYE
ncbi:hypothetical protein [Xanthomonas sp. SHU 199]|uniref:hypothetical protein n=1 Tax=Xanthomonas sp. SHU 199 TaxID=1591174 RepID=UPI000374FE57|nr:hypothetical protein [Xanthomonas sp. SHU 199]